MNSDLTDSDERAMQAVAAELLSHAHTQRAETKKMMRRTTAPLPLASGIQRKADSLAAEIRVGSVKRNPGRQIACRSGCAWCCYQPVEASADEVLVLARRANALSGPQRDAFWERVRAYGTRFAELTGRDMTTRSSANIPCPALSTDNTCSLYSARPSACRGHDSMDVAICEAAMDDPTLAGPGTLAPQMVMGLLVGHKRALHERGYDGRGYDLPMSLVEVDRVGLTECERRWAAKEQVFSDAALADYVTNEMRSVMDEAIWGSDL